MGKKEIDRQGREIEKETGRQIGTGTEREVVCVCVYVCETER